MSTAAAVKYKLTFIDIYLRKTVCSIFFVLMFETIRRISVPRLFDKSKK